MGPWLFRLNNQTICLYLLTAFAQNLFVIFFTLKIVEVPKSLGGHRRF